MVPGLLFGAVLVGPVLIGVIGAGLGVTLAVRALRSMRGVGSPGRESGLSRMRAAVGTGLEQTVIGTVRSLNVPHGATDVAYGQLYFESDADRRVLIRSRSMLDRGLLAVLAFEPAGRRTLVTYSIVRLPSDDGVHAAALEFEVTLVQAIRRLDPMAEVHLTSSALRGVERTTSERPRPGTSR